MTKFLRTKVVGLVAASATLAIALPAMAADATNVSVSVGQKPSVKVSVTSTPGSAGRSEASQMFRIRARVPVACWVRPDAPIFAVPGTSGEVTEACNNPGGFTVTANYRPLLATEKAEIIYDNQAHSLDGIGSRLLRHSSVATVKQVSYRFGEVDLESPLTLNLVIQPI